MREEIMVALVNGKLFVDRGAVRVKPGTRVHWQPVDKNVKFRVGSFKCINANNAKKPFDHDDYQSNDSKGTAEAITQKVNTYTLIYTYELSATFIQDGKEERVVAASDPVVIIDPPGSDDDKDTLHL